MDAVNKQALAHRRAFWQATSAVGQRFVPVEQDYFLESGYKIMPISQFVAHCARVDVDGAATAADSSADGGLSAGGYLAQHTLIDQVRALAKDVLTPDIAVSTAACKHDCSRCATRLHTDGAVARPAARIPRCGSCSLGRGAR